jgi:hypothetical protein
MNWKPISEEEILNELNSAWERMSVPKRRFWDSVCIAPEKWQQHPFGDMGGGFWAVALIGRTVVWYNDIEGGFNRSNYSKYGEIDAYWCNQDEIETVLRYIMDEIETGRVCGPYLGPPKPMD